MSQTPSPKDGATERSLPRNVKVLGAASLLNDVASEMIAPLLPTFLILYLGGGPVHLGLIEGVADSVSSFLKLYSGGWSDRAGQRKGFIVVGYTLAAVSRPLVGLLVAPWQLLLTRTADRLGKGIRSSPRDALIADSTEPGMRGRAFGFHRAMDHLGAAIGPLLAVGFLLLWPGELRLLFLLTLLPGLLVVLLLLLGLKETAPTGPPKAPLQLTLAPFARDFRVYLVALVVFTLGNSSDMFLLWRAGELGVPLKLLPVLWCVFHLAKSGGNWLVGRVVERAGPRRLLFLGWLLYAAVYLAFALATQAWHAWAFFLAYALFYALTESAEKTLVVHLTDAEHKGLAFGWFNFALGVATLPANLIFGALYQQFGALVAFGWSAGLALVAVFLLAGVRAARAG